MSSAPPTTSGIALDAAGGERVVHCSAADHRVRRSETQCRCCEGRSGADKHAKMLLEKALSKIEADHAEATAEREAAMDAGGSKDAREARPRATRRAAEGEEGPLLLEVLGLHQLLVGLCVRLHVDRVLHEFELVLPISSLF